MKKQNKFQAIIDMKKEHIKMLTKIFNVGASANMEELKRQIIAQKEEIKLLKKIGG
jgi:hypothetical protein